MSYQVQGSLAIQVKGGDVKFLLYPANAYLSPDKSCAVLYPVMIENQKNQATLLKLTNGYLEFDYATTTTTTAECKSLLSQIALQSKTVALTVSTEPLKDGGIIKSSITGFTYPIPRA